jgi:hypothetical protein
MSEPFGKAQASKDPGKERKRIEMKYIYLVGRKQILLRLFERIGNSDAAERPKGSMSAALFVKRTRTGDAASRDKASMINLGPERETRTDAQQSSHESSHEGS